VRRNGNVFGVSAAISQTEDGVAGRETFAVGGGDAVDLAGEFYTQC